MKNLKFKYTKYTSLLDKKFVSREEKKIQIRKIYSYLDSNIAKRLGIDV
jgi:hypothetical protein